MMTHTTPLENADYSADIEVAFENALNLVNAQEPARSSPSVVRGGKASVQWGQGGADFSEGFLVVPLRLLRGYGRKLPKPLTAAEVVFVLCVMSFKWGDEAPFPSYARLADYMGVSEKMVRRYAQHLEAKGYLKRIPRRNSSNAFDLTGLFEALRQIRVREESTDVS